MLRKILILIALCLSMAANARKTDIYGRVTDAESGEGIRAIKIMQNGIPVGLTADGGYFKVNADTEGTLQFVSSTFYKSADVAVDGRLEVDVQLHRDAQRLNEVSVFGKGRKIKKLDIEDAELEQNGNWIKLPDAKMQIPKHLYDASSRIIVQPALYCVTDGTLYYMAPKVIDGPRYAITQERMYDWDEKLDTLVPYRTIKTSKDIKTPPNNIITMRDSVEVPNPHADFMGVAFMSIENYNRLIYADTMQYAQGTSNPLRLMQYKLNPVYMSDSIYIPTERPEQRVSAGKMDLIFPVNVTTLDMGLGNNQSEINKLLADLQRFETDPTFTLKELTISGTASPEGRYDRNKTLASQRMGSAMALVRDNLSANILKRATVKTEAEVAPWEDLVALLRQDSRNDEADAVQAILDKYAGIDARGAAISRLPFYRSLIAAEYLPKMRRVEYTLRYEHFRPLTLDETKEAYAADSLALSRYNYYNLYTHLEGDDRIRVMRNAIKAHPDFICAYTDLAAEMLKREQNPRELLQPFFKNASVYPERPNDMRYNMALACLANHEINRADTLIFPLPNEPRYLEAQMYIEALSGNVTDKAIEEISKSSPVNGVMLMLKKKYNVQAWEKSKTLGDSAIENYVKAMCCNRMALLYDSGSDEADDLYIEAEDYLKRALELDPKLRETAAIDSDMVMTLESLEHNEQYTPEQPEESEESVVETTNAE